FTDVTGLKEALGRLGRSAQEQGAIAELGRRALVGADLDALLDEATHVVSKTLGFPLAAVLEAPSGGESFRLRAGAGWKKGVVGRDFNRASASWIPHVLEARGPVALDGRARETRLSGSAFLREHRARSGICVAIGGPRAPFGILSAFDTQHREPTAEDFRFLSGAASALALAIQRWTAQEAMQALNRDLESRV